MIVDVHVEDTLQDYTKIDGLKILKIKYVISDIEKLLNEEITSSSKSVKYPKRLNRIKKVKESIENISGLDDYAINNICKSCNKENSNYIDVTEDVTGYNLDCKKFEKFCKK